MNGFYLRFRRWRKKLLFAAAALPMLQATGTCDPFSINSLIVQQLATSTLGVVSGSIQQVLLQSFPSADVLQILLGGNRQPFFQN